MRNIIIFGFALFSVSVIFAQTRNQMQFDDSVSVRQTRPPRPGENPTESIAISQSGLYSAWARGDDGNRNGCSSSRINRSGVAMSVTVQGPEFGRTLVLVKDDPSAGWRMGAYALNSTTAQAFVPIGGAFCVTSTDSRGVGTYFVSVFKSSISENDFPMRELWNDRLVGYTSFNDDPGSPNTNICYTRQVYRRTISYGTPRVVFISNDRHGFSESPTDPSTRGCAGEYIAVRE